MRKLDPTVQKTYNNRMERDTRLFAAKLAIVGGIMFAGAGIGAEADRVIDGDFGKEPEGFEQSFEGTIVDATQIGIGAVGLAAVGWGVSTHLKDRKE